MTKIKVKPEGRPDIWLVEDKESLKAFIREHLEGKEVHNFINGVGIVVGADHSLESVLDDIDGSERIAVMTDPNANMGHALAIADVKLEMYDIGPVTKEDLEVVE